VSVSFSKRDRLVEFLIRRVDGRPVLLPLIKTMIEEQDPLASIARTFDLINATARHAIVPSGRCAIYPFMIHTTTRRLRPTTDRQKQIFAANVQSTA
jgi:hypothetical protein